MNKKVLILSVWGMFQYMTMLQLAGSGVNTWLICGLGISNLGMMYLLVDFNEKYKKLKGE